MLTRVHITSFIALTLFIYLMALWFLGEQVWTVSYAQPFGILVTTLVSISVIFTKWAWSWPVFRGWYIQRPDIRGTWLVELKSNWTDPKTGKGVPSINAYLSIRQTLTSLSMRLMTKESKSRSIAYSLEKEDDGFYRIAGVYRNEPNIELQGEKSEIHHGSLILELHGTPPISLNGHYWTDRGTRGSMITTNHNKTLYDSYENARRAFKED